MRLCVHYFCFNMNCSLKLKEHCSLCLQRLRCHWFGETDVNFEGSLGKYL